MLLTLADTFHVDHKNSCSLLLSEYGISGDHHVVRYNSTVDVERMSLSLSDPMSDLIRHYDFPVPLLFLTQYGL
jgi:hypothetical protein